MREADHEVAELFHLLHLRQVAAAARRCSARAFGSRRFSSCAMPTGRMLVLARPRRCSPARRCGAATSAGCGSCSRGSQARRAVVWRFLSAEVDRLRRLRDREALPRRTSGRGRACAPSPPAAAGRCPRARAPSAHDAGRAHQHERADARGVAHRHLHRHPAAHRAADDHRLLELQRCEEIEIEVGDVVDVLEPLGLVRSARSRDGRARSRRSASASFSMNGSTTGAPLAPCRKTSGAPFPAAPVMRAAAVDFDGVVSERHAPACGRRRRTRR